MKKNVILFVGANLVENRPFYRYILREISQSISHIDEIIQISSNKFLITIEKILADKVNLIIITSNTTFTTVSKVLATILGDTLELRSNILIPTKTKVYEEGSFLLEMNDSQVNVIKAQECKTVPPLLIEDNQTMILHIFDLDIESIEILIEPLTKSFEIDLSYCQITHGWVKVHCKSKKHGEMNHFISSAKKLFSGKVIDSKNIFKYLIQKLHQNEKTLTIAESCTGGLIASKFTAQSGASAILNGSLVAYSNEIKHEWLGVDQEVFDRFGAVSIECVSQMNQGAISISKADFSIAVSGIAGPTGGSEYKPVGTVVIGVGVKKNDKIETVAKEFHFEGDRNYIQEQTLYSAIKMLIFSDKKLFL